MVPHSESSAALLRGDVLFCCSKVNIPLEVRTYIRKSCFYVKADNMAFCKRFLVFSLQQHTLWSSVGNPVGTSVHLKKVDIHS